mmetsp:Transcript_87187/g.174161  ORF Transcript_87187/g.174161 Transcript_87187/m.174161 type:complete len:90 (+) Transcript_87187:16-285(+)
MVVQSSPGEVRRILLFPSLPPGWKLSPGVGNLRSWIGAALILSCALLLLPALADAFEAGGSAVRRAFVSSTTDFARSLKQGPKPSIKPR